jgi:hypothetical protein
VTFSLDGRIRAAVWCSTFTIHSPSTRKAALVMHPWDELSKSLAEQAVPRRETLRRIGVVLGGALLGPFGLGTAWAGRPDPCKSFCRCSKKAQQNQCLAACKACKGNTSRLCGRCGSYACCASGLTCCGGACVDLFDDFNHCGACAAPCDYPAPYEEGACVWGECVYWCVEGALDCNGRCVPVQSDPRNCGACGHVCPPSAPYCIQGTCRGNTTGCPGGQTYCSGACYDLYNDSNNCGTSCENRVACGIYMTCTGGVCVPVD